MKTTAYEATKEKRLVPCAVEQALEARHSGSGVHWIHLEDFGPHELRTWLEALDLTPFTINRLRKMGQVTKVVAAPGALVLDFRVLVGPGQGLRRHVAALCVPNLLVTFDPSPTDEEFEPLAAIQGMEIVDPSPGGLLCSVLLFLADQTGREQQEALGDVLELDTRMDREPGAVRLDEILDLKDRLLLLLAVAEEQLESFEALGQVNNDVWERTEYQGTVGLLLAIGTSNDRRIDRLEKRVVDLRQRYDTHQADRTNHRLGVLTILSAIFMPLGLMAGIWGMNFERMPELKFPWAYPVALSLMVTVAAGMLWFFQRKGWFR